MKSKVMIVDDHHLFLEDFNTCLMLIRLSSRKSENGREAVTKARILKPDIILMDIMMPEMDGIEALK